MPKRNLAWILVVGTIALLWWQLPQTIAVRDSVYEAFGPLVSIRAEIRKRYVEEIDDSELVHAAVSAGIDAMVSQLHDPHARYLTKGEYERFQKRTDGVFGGIGVEVWASEGGLEVLSREPNSPAAVAGILPRETITHIDGVATAGLSLVVAVNGMLNGSAGSEVTLTVRSADGSGEASVREVRVRRDLIHYDPIRGWSRSAGGGWRYMLDREARIGYVRLRKFTPNVAQRMDKEIDRLLQRGLRGLVLDLRENTGGLFDSGIEVADCFLDRGLLVTRSGRKTDEKNWYASREGTHPGFELAVLVNGSTASAAELVAGALRDHGRAAIVGERTYGKGSVQEVVELDRGAGAIKLTTAYYYLPGGQCIHRTREAVEAGEWGVTPTLPVSLTERQRDHWLAAWREISREVMASSASEPADRTASAVARAVAREAAQTLLGADVQLRQAVEYLVERIGPSDSTGGAVTGGPRRG